MNSDKKKIYYLLNSSYFFIFFAFGALFPLLTVYLEHIGLNGKEIGVLTAIGPIVTILTQPLWGMVSDRYQIQRQMLFLSIILVSGIAILFPWFYSFLALILLIILLHTFQAPITPIADTIALNFAYSAGIGYGNIRLWGAIGYAVAVFVTGLIAERTMHSSIFYIFAITLLASIFFLRPIPSDANRTHVNVLSGVGKLLKLPHFLLFLSSSFFMFGPINANNYYFGIYYQHIGGTLAGIGLVFLFAAGSEAPFMRVAGIFIKRLGLEYTLVLAGIVSLLQWLVYYSVHNPILIFSVFLLQGISVGLYLTAAPQYVRDYTPAEIQVTGLTLYTAFGNGIGTFVCNLIGGWIYDQSSIFYTYLFFACFSVLGTLSILMAKKVNPAYKRPRQKA